MSEKAKARYFEMLAQKISSLYNVAIDAAWEAVEGSAIQSMVRECPEYMVRECPEYVGHVSIYEWAEEVYQEMLVV